VTGCKDKEKERERERGRTMERDKQTFESISFEIENTRRKEYISDAVCVVQISISFAEEFERIKQPNNRRFRLLVS
jgi:hypothetical protein